MKNIVKLILAGSALAAAGAAGAATITNTPAAAGGSDLVLFVTDLSNNAVFVQDLGVNISSLGVTTASINADNTAGNQFNVDGLNTVGPLNNPVGANGLDSSLASFLTANAGGNFVYGILGASIGNGTTGIGQAQVVATIAGAPSTAPGGSTNAASLFQSDPQSSDASFAVQTTNSFFLQTNLGNPGGTPYGAATGNGHQAAGTDGLPNDAALGSSLYLYELASMGPGNDANMYGSSTPITISTAGVISGFGSASPVPLPASLLLLGSGVIGLFGIGRRRLNGSAGNTSFGGFAF
jgi:hypothetical protein